MFILAYNIDPDLQKYILKFGYGINCKYGGQLSQSIDGFYAVTKFQLLKLSDIPMRFKRMPVDYNNCEYLFPCNIMEYGHIWGDISNGQVQYICFKVMF